MNTHDLIKNKKKKKKNIIVFTVSFNAAKV